MRVANGNNARADALPALRRRFTRRGTQTPPRMRGSVKGGPHAGPKVVLADLSDPLIFHRPDPFNKYNFWQLRYLLNIERRQPAFHHASSAAVTRRAAISLALDGDKFTRICGPDEGLGRMPSYSRSPRR
jgi:hypothetical protein